VSYRREEAAGYAGRLYDMLQQQLGPDAVLMDVDLGARAYFREAIASAIERCDVVLAVIGPRWLSISDANGKRRLDDARDFVHMEIALALHLERPIVPVLVQRARLPGATELPAELSALARRKAVKLDDARWHYDVSRLIQSLVRAGVSHQARGKSA
jgi:hypothetical protein